MQATRGRDHAVRINMPRQAVIKPCRTHHESGIQADGDECKRPTGGCNRRSTDDGGQRDCAARRVQAAGKAHHHDRPAYRDRRAKHGIGEEQCSGMADQCRHHIAADHRPWLGKRACRHSEQQDRRRAHRGDQKGERAIITVQP